MINLYKSPTRSLCYTIIWMLSVIPYCVSSIDERHENCTLPFSCGNQTYLNYPFWTSEREECGHPKFEVKCNEDYAEFNISSVKFRVLEMNIMPRMVRLARMDYLNNLCPKFPENATINQHVLPFLPDTELRTFYYNCLVPATGFPLDGYIIKINCENNSGRQSFFASSPLGSSDKAILDVFIESCERIVDVQVSQSALKSGERNMSEEVIKRVLEEGFKLGFNSECSLCEDSMGACGYSRSSGKFVCYCMNGPHKHTCDSKGLSKKAKIGIAWACVTLGLGASVIIFMWWFCIRKRETSHYPRERDLKTLALLKHYSYAEVKRITKSFSHKIGKGGFGTVYAGNLGDGRKVAVKILKDIKSNGEDFINEVASMGQTSHVNIVSLLGFCYEGPKRAIVYEFLENGSLDQYISSKSSMNLDVGVLSGIALGVARGLEYLHHGCKTRIVHFDIKPQNILLDENFCPKLSDFGLAKLCEKRESIMSLLHTRGTIGYIAPEVFSRMYGRVSHKSDVYSFGMLVLELIGARNREIEEAASSAYFPDWIYKELEIGEDTWRLRNEITREEEDIAKKMTVVGLWCIQPNPSNRPPMNRVVEMMEGSLDALQVPPKPSLHFSAVPIQQSSSLSEEDSKYSEVFI